MHYWGDEWFQKHGSHLYDAIAYIEKNLRKRGISVAGKEKYGTYRDEYLRVWDGGLYSVLFGGRMYIGPYRHSKFKWIAKLQDWFHCFIYWRIDRGWTRKMMNETDFEKQQKMFRERFIDKDENWITHGLQEKVIQTKWYKRYIERRKDDYNRVFQEACKLWPDVVDELICDIDGWQMIKPGKWGDIDGAAIHNKYWMPMTSETTINIQ